MLREGFKLRRATSTGRRLSALLILSLLFSAFGFTATAANPTSGTISATNTSVSYTAGPFVLANVTGTAGDVVCSAATPCDDFSLAVNLASSYQTSSEVRVKIEWPNSAADFDLYVLDAAGNPVSSSASSSDPEVVILPATSANYTVRVVPFAPLGDSFTGTITLAPKAANPAPSGETAPTYQNYTPPAGSGLGTSAGEPSIGVNHKTGKVFFQSNTQTLRVNFNDTTAPATATWEDKSAPTAVTSLDPILFTDSKTGRTFESQLLLAGSLSEFTDNDGDSWTPSQGSGIASGVDHQTIGGGPFAKVAGDPGPLTAYPNAVYYCSQDIGDALCALSRDGGLTYGPAVPIYNLTQCGGLHGHVKVAPDGTVYVPNKGCGGQQAVVVSENNGLTWSVRKVPGSTPGASDPSVGIASDGTVYFGYQNGDGHPRVAVSHDKGLTWSYNQDVGTAFGIQNTVFPAVVAGDPTRGAFAFLGTPSGGDSQDCANFKGVWHLYVAHTYDGGQTWVTSDATPSDPVQIGAIWLGGGSNACRNLLDFMDATVDAQGRVLVGYADGCTTSDCTTTNPTNHTRTELATISRQTSGKRLFAAYDQPDLTVSGLKAYYSSKGNSLAVTVNNPGTANASGVVVKFMDGTTVIGTSAPVNVASGGSSEVRVAWNTKGQKGSRTITAIVDPSNSIAEANETNNTIQAAIPTRG